MVFIGSYAKDQVLKVEVFLNRWRFLRLFSKKLPRQIVCIIRVPRIT